jgi:serine protease Do
MSGRFVCFLVFGIGLLPAFLPAQGDALALQQRVIDVFEQNKDAVVQVKAAYAQPGVTDEGKKEVMLRVGTGFFISREGHVLVSASRAAGADRVWIEHRDRSYATEAVGHDRLTNISILRTLEPPEEFSTIKIDTAVGRPRTGAFAVAISCPLDFGPSPATGLFTGLDKKMGDKFFPTEYIRTSVSVDAGQGGCPMLDINGRFIGMSVASIPDLDGSYLLPADALARVRDDLMFEGKVIHSWLGFEVRGELNGDNQNDVILSKVIEEAPAALGGLREGDQLISIGGRPINDVSDVPSAVFFTRANQFTTIEVMRDGQRKELSVKALPRPEAGAEIRPAEIDPAASPEALPAEPGE